MTPGLISRSVNETNETPVPVHAISWHDVYVDHVF